MNRRVRDKVVEALWWAERRGRFVEDALQPLYPRALKAAERALVTELAFGTTRWRGTFDHILGRYRALTTLRPRLLWILRVALYQMGILGRIPHRVAVAAAVEQARAAFGTGGAGLANALLRRVQGEWLRQPRPAAGVDPRRDVVCSEDAVWRGPEAAFPDPAAHPNTNLAVRFSVPEWLVARWAARFAGERLVSLVAAQNRRPALHCWVDPAAGPLEAVREALHRERIETEPTPHGLRVRRGAGRLAASAPFRAGKLVVQDEVSAAVVPFLAPRRGERVLEVGAAPGGKTVALARAVGGEGRVVAVDRSRRRLARLRENLARVGLEARVECLAADGTRLPAAFSARFDRVLIDAPCSNTGVLARRPEARWRLAPAGLRTLAALQTRLLAEGLRALRPGAGVLVYATCSIEPEENHDVVAAAPPRAVVEAEELVLPDRSRDGGYRARLRLRRG